jgi:hypothetical protein
MVVWVAAARVLCKIKDPLHAQRMSSRTDAGAMYFIDALHKMVPLASSQHDRFPSRSDLASSEP